MDSSLKVSLTLYSRENRKKEEEGKERKEKEGNERKKLPGFNMVELYIFKELYKISSRWWKSYS